MGSSLLVPMGQPGPMKPGEYVPIAPSNQVSFNTLNVAPPSPLYIQSDERIGLQFMTNHAGELLTYSIRLLRAKDGVIVPVEGQISSTGTYAIQAATIQLSEGWLLGISVNGSSADRGRTFVRGCITRLPFNAVNPTRISQLLFADYVTQFGFAGWPGGRSVSPVEGPGFIYASTAANPSAGADISAAVPASSRWRMQWLAAHLVTSASAGNRNVAFNGGLFSSGSLIGAPASQTAGTTKHYHFSPNIGQYTDAAGTISVPTPVNAITPRGSAVGTSTAGILAGDQWTIDSLVVEEWLEF